MNSYAVAIHSFQENLNSLERQGRKDSPDWHLTYGLLQLAHGLKQDHDDQEERLRCFARSARTSRIAPEASE